MANRSFFRRLGLADEVGAPVDPAQARRRRVRRALLALGPVIVALAALPLVLLLRRAQAAPGHAAVME